MRKYELKTKNTSQKSFYGKAVVTVYNPDFIVLTSYKTDVAAIVDGEFVRLWEDWSATTAKHVNEFRIQNGFKAVNKTDWLKLPVMSLNDADYIFQIVKGA